GVGIMKYTRAMPRRTFLRGLGATMALPLLDSMAPAASVSAASAPPIRLGYVYTPNGIVGACDKSPRPFMWTPKASGANFEFSPTMKVLEPFRDEINVFSGLAQVTGRALGDGPGDHARATATFLTGVQPYKNGGGDKRRLEEYLESVRDIERRIQLAESQNVELPHIERPGAIPEDYLHYTKLMIDMQVVAWQTDMTRVASLMLGRDGSNRAYREIGISDGHHSISHHQGDQERLDKLIKIDELHVSMFAYLLEKLKATPDGDGTLLDHALVLFGSSISESNIHTHDDLPI